MTAWAIQAHRKEISKVEVSPAIPRAQGRAKVRYLAMDNPRRALSEGQMPRLVQHNGSSQSYPQRPGRGG